MAFQKAQKGKKPVRLTVNGPSGSGKSYTSLLFATYLSTITGKPTAAIDTEHFRLSLYADKFPFDVDNVEPPFDPRKLIKSIHDAENAGYGQLVIDSSTHYYAGTGGLLEIVQDAAKTKFGGNQYAGWAVGTPIQNDLIDVILRTPLHIICTTRAKMGHLETEKNGRKTYEKTGMETIQRDGWDYDFDFSLMMDMDNNALVTKGMGLVVPGMYLKKPGATEAQMILDSINESSVDGVAYSAPVKIAEESLETKMVSLKANVMTLIPQLIENPSVGKEKYQEVLFKYTNGKPNPNVIKDYDTMNNLYMHLKQLENKEN